MSVCVFICWYLVHDFKVRHVIILKVRLSLMGIYFFNHYTREANTGESVKI